MPLMTFKRKETKYKISSEQFKSIMPVLMEHMKLDKHNNNGQLYSIYNIYYDTPNNDVIRLSTSHPKYKEKLRLRCYKIPRTSEDIVFIELKKKIAGTVNKRRAVLSRSDCERFLQYREIPEDANNLEKQVLREIAYYFSHMPVSPAVALSYDRLALFDKHDPDLRISFDSNIRARRDQLYFCDNHGELLLPEGYYIMEIKHPGVMPVWLTDLLCANKIYKQSFSKYGTEYKNYLLKQRR